MTGDDWGRWREDWHSRSAPISAEAGRAALRRGRVAALGELASALVVLILVGGALWYGTRASDRLWLAALTLFLGALGSAEWADRRWARVPLGEPTEVFRAHFAAWCERRLGIARWATVFLVVEAVTLVPLALLRLREPSPTDSVHRGVAVALGAVLLTVAVSGTLRMVRVAERRLTVLRDTGVEVPDERGRRSEQG